MKEILFSLFFLFNLLTINIIHSQTITPYTLSNGGGSSATMEWSLGESVSIANFIASGYSLNTGVLQPMTSIVTAINEYGPAVFGTQITIGPNPTSNLHAFEIGRSKRNSIIRFEYWTKDHILFIAEVINGQYSTFFAQQKKEF